MDVVEQLLIPGVEDGGETQLAPKTMLGIGTKLLKGFRDTPEKQVVDHLLVGQGQGVNFMRKGEDAVEVAHRQEFPLACRQPSGLGQGLALGAMAIAAGVVDRTLVVAGITLLQMATQIGSATILDGMHHLEMGQGQGMGLPVSWAVLKEDVGHFPLGPLGYSIHCRP